MCVVFYKNFIRKRSVVICTPPLITFAFCFKLQNKPLFVCDSGVFDGMFDCSDLSRYAINVSGVYPLLSDATSHPLSRKDVYCDMETERGG